MAEALCAISSRKMEGDMAKILIKNADVLTLNESGNVLRRTNVAIAEGKIT